MENVSEFLKTAGSKFAEWAVNSSEWLYDHMILQYGVAAIIGAIVAVGIVFVIDDSEAFSVDNGDGTSTVYTYRFHKKVIANSEEE